MSSTPDPPERLWKYRPWNEHAKAMITSGELFFTGRPLLNDPFEFRYLEKLPTTNREIDHFVREFCASLFPMDSLEERRARYASFCSQLKRYAKDRRGGLGPTEATFQEGVLCLSETNDDILMWSHYSLNHSGVCVALRPALINRLTLPVIYSDKVPIIDGWDFVRRDREKFVIVSRTKAMNWAYEREWRSIDHPGPKVFPKCVDQVVIGALATPGIAESVREVAASAPQKVEVYRARLNAKRYSLDIVPDDDPP